MGLLKKWHFKHQCLTLQPVTSSSCISTRHSSRVRAGLARIEAHDGDAWHEVATYTSSTSNPTPEIVDLSAIVGGITNGQLRFIWSGNGSGYWAIDNISIYASLPLDGGVVSLDNPDSPVAPGVHDIEITLGNFGYNTISSTTVEWTADGIPQTPFNFNGSIGFGQTQSGVVIGNYNFQEPVLLKIWQTDPNGQTDQNPFNDTITKLLSVPLCGTYTIGGNDPDFETFSEVADVLNAAGITCPVTFLVRDGTYYEQFILRDIPGTSASNTVTFRSESGDSTQAVLQIIPEALKYEPMILLEGTQYINFERLGLFTGSVASFANSAISMEGADHITISNCYFESWKQFDFSIEIFAGSNNIEFSQNRIECLSQRSGAIQIYGEGTQQISVENNYINGAVDWGFKTLEITDNASYIEITGNLIEDCYQGIYLKESEFVNILENQINNSNNGVVVSELCSSINISKNRLSNIKNHKNEPDGTKGIFVKSSSEIAVTNNFIHTYGDGPVHGIYLEDVSLNQIIYNSINITNNDKLGKSKGIAISESNNIIGRNNIFNIKQGGTPIYIEQAASSIDFDYNDYYSYNKLIGFYNGTFYYDIPSWSNELGMDVHSISIIPFYTSDTNLSINQILLNNVGVPVSGIPQDIDGTLRGANPDIGAKEYDLCPIDAGINQIVSPENPLNGGNEQIRVMLQNQGQNNLSAVELHWQINEIVQTPYQWSGNLSSAGNEVVEIGSFNFQAGTVYTLKIWTVDPNNTTDCNNHNDTLLSRELAVPLCGTYTLGGAGADFTSFYQTSTVLNIAGISCPVTIMVRDGIYYEQFVLGIIPGASETNTITFRSESSDSTQAIVKIDPNALKSESMIYLEGTENIIFQSLGFHTGSEVSDANYAISMAASKNISLENCHIEVLNQYDIGVFVNQGSNNISFLNNRFKSDNYRAGAMKISGETTRDIFIINNHINGSTDWSYKTINIEEGASKLELSGNLIEQCHIPIYLVSTDSSTITDNIIKDSDFGITISDFCSQIDISANRLLNIRNDQNIQDETIAITVKYASGIDIYNNYIQTAGGGPVIGIYIQQSGMGRVVFNSINSTNQTSQLASKGLLLERASEYTVQNNILNMKQAGIPADPGRETMHSSN